MKEKRITCEKARNICIVKTLATLGHFPSKESEKEAWFPSPFRSETQASFKVSKTLNRWYDHGLGKGGNIIDFGIQYYSCSVGEFLKKLDGGFSFQKPIQNIPKIENAPEYPLKILKEVEINPNLFFRSRFLLMRYFLC